MRSTLSRRLASVVASSGLSQVDFGTTVGADRKTVNAWLNGRNEPSMPMLRRICRVHRISADWLLGLDCVRGDGQRGDAEMLE